jgi:hypothetical protein
MVGLRAEGGRELVSSPRRGERGSDDDLVEVSGDQSELYSFYFPDFRFILLVESSDCSIV